MKNARAELLPRAASPKGLIILSLIFAILVSTPFMLGEAFASDLAKGKDMVELKSITVNKISKEIRIKTKLAITEGILEYLLVGHHGKTYESVFKVMDNKPSELNFALLLIGCEPLNFNQFMKLIGEKGAVLEALKGHEESVLEIEIYREGNKVQLGSLVKDREGSGKPLIWVFTGGYFTQDNKYVGDMELSYIGFWPDPSAVINLFSALGNPYQGNFGFEMNQNNKELKVDQDFEIVIRRHEL